MSRYITKKGNKWDITADFLLLVRDLAALNYTTARMAQTIGMPYETLAWMRRKDYFGVRTMIEQGKQEQANYRYCSLCDDYYTHPDDLRSLAIYKRCYMCNLKHTNPTKFKAGILIWN